MSSQSEQTTQRHRMLTTEFLGEVVLLLFVGATFFYMLYDSREWGTGAWLLPRITIFFGLPFWVWRLVALFKTGMAADGGRIMDMGFLETTDSAAVVSKRWVKLIGSTGALLGGVWLFGFHVAIPAYTILYLTVFAKMKWYWTIIPAVFFESIIVFIYGNLLLAEWNTPAVLEWWNAARGN